MFNIDEYVKDLVDSGFEKDKALEITNCELKRRKELLSKNEIEHPVTSFKDKIDRYKR